MTWMIDIFINILYTFITAIVTRTYKEHFAISKNLISRIQSVNVECSVLTLVLYLLHSSPRNSTPLLSS